MRPHDFANENYYHIYNRGVDRREIFLDDHDRQRFLQSLMVLNNACRPANTRMTQQYSPRTPYMHLAAYCLMPNHFHLVLRQSVDAGISACMQRWLNSYTKYFNARHSRKGRLFESVYQSVPIDNDAQLLHATRYVHLNPLSIIEPGWKEHGIGAPGTALAYIRNYPWSSYSHYIRRTRNEYVSDTTICDDYGPGEYQQFVEAYVKDVLTPGVSRPKEG